MSEVDDLRATAATTAAALAVAEADRDRYRDAFLRMNEACTAREAALGHAQVREDALRKAGNEWKARAEVAEAALADEMARPHSCSECGRP